MRLTGNRALDKEYLLFLRRENIISATELKRKVGVLERREARVVAAARAREEAAEARAAAKAAAREAAIQAKERAREAARAAKKAAAAAARAAKAQARKDKKGLKNELIRKVVMTDEVDVYNLWKQGGNFRVITNAHDFLVNYVADYSKGYRIQWLEGNESDSNFKFDAGETVLLVRPSNISAARLKQAFRAGVSHCVFTPILQKLESRLEGVAAATAKRVKQRIAALKKLETEYSAGVPEDKMESVAKAAGMKIQLFDVLGNSLAVYNEHGREGCLRMTNTRENHVEIGLVVDSEPVEMSADEMKELWRELREQGEFYMIDGDLKDGQPTRIRTLKSAFAMKDKVQERCKEFDKELGILNYKVNATKQPVLNEFLKAGRIVNGWGTELGGSDATGCADMPAAYSQFESCSEYAGFLGHIHQFRSGSFSVEFIKEHLGYYGGKVVSGGNWLLEKLGITVGKYVVLFSPELLFLMKLGVQFEIDQGAWGSRFDFQFPDYMMEDRAYCHWAGRLGMERLETSHTLVASREWAEHIASDHKVFYWERDGLLTIKKPVKNVFTAHHILGAITAYTRIQMIEALMEFKPEQLCRVVMDGIYYTGKKPEALAWFKDKKVKKAVVKTIDSDMPWYSDVIVEKFPEMGRIMKNSVLIGQGGSGKTWSVFKDPGFNTVLYAAPSHLLGQDVNEKYGAKYTTINKLIGIDCRPYCDEFRVPPVIFVDEITQVDSAWVEKVFELYPESLILLAGDIDSTGRWYQCRSGNGAEWSSVWKPHDVDVISFEEDRRSRDDKLKKLKLLIRDVMRQCNGDNAEMSIKLWAMKNLPISSLDFQKGDTVIAGTHNTNRKLLDMGIVSGYYKKGGWVSFEEKEGYEKRGSFTIHAYQGKTIESGRVWIVLDDMFEYAMLYTAVSRAVNFDQLRFIRRV